MAEAVRKWQHDALPKISGLSHAIAIPMDGGDWSERPDSPGYYTRRRP